MLNHTRLDPCLEGLEIDWQNDKCLAVTGKSKNIYLWDITAPLLPKMSWSVAPSPGSDQASEVEQIKWDPSGQILASTSVNDSTVSLWKPEKSTQAHVFTDQPFPG